MDSASSRAGLDQIVLPSPLSDRPNFDEGATAETSPNPDDGFSDSDSAIGDDTASETRSLTASVLSHEYENGRRYHSYHAGEYPMPNDELEQARMDMQHHLYLMIFGGELYRAPLPSRIGRALDIGCGTGKWACDFADSRPQTEVIGERVHAFCNTQSPF